MNRERANAIADLFDAAYDLIDMEGWAQNGAGADEGPCCVGHALVRAARERRNGALAPCIRILQDAIGQRNITRWNDTRKHEMEVLILLEQLADRYRRKAESL